MNPVQNLLMEIEGRIQNATAKGIDADCVSRSFCPKLSIQEDPVCGFAHCQIADYWSKELNEVKGCLGCNACRYGKPCVQKDAFNGFVPKIKDADCIVFASPLYFWTVSSRIKAFIERFYCIAEEDSNPPLGRYEKYPVKDCALLMTSADDFFWTFEQAVSYYQFTMVNYIGFQDRGMVLAGGCGDTNGKPQIDKTAHLQAAYEFGKNIYSE